MIIIMTVGAKIRLAYDKRNKDNGSKYYEYAQLADNDYDHSESFEKRYARVLNEKDTIFRIKLWLLCAFGMGALFTNGLIGTILSFSVVLVIVMAIVMLIVISASDRLKYGKIETFEDKVNYYMSLENKRRKAAFDLLFDSGNEEIQAIIAEVNRRLELQRTGGVSERDNFSFSDNSLDALSANWRK